MGGETEAWLICSRVSERQEQNPAVLFQSKDLHTGHPNIKAQSLKMIPFQSKDEGYSAGQ